MWTPSSGWRPTARTWLSVLALGLVLWLIVRHTALIFELLAVLFAAYLVTLAISPLADFLARRRIPRAITALAFYALALSLLVLVGRLLIPVVRMETAHLRRMLPIMLEQALTVLRNLPIPPEWLPSARTLAQTLTQGTDGLVRPAFGVVINAGGVLLDIFVVLVLAFFFVVDQKLGEGLLYGWIPPAQQTRTRRLAQTLNHRLTRWIWAQAAVAVYFAVAFGTVLGLLYVPFAFTIGIIGGVLELVPYLGGFIAFSLAVLSALTVNPVLVLWIALLYVIVIETEGHILAPALYGRVTGLQPAAVLIALFVGAKAAGLVGVLPAVPVAVVVATLIEEAQQGRVYLPALPRPGSDADPAPTAEMEKR